MLCKNFCVLNIISNNSDNIKYLIIKIFKFIMEFIYRIYRKFLKFNDIFKELNLKLSKGFE